MQKETLKADGLTSDLTQELDALNKDRNEILVFWHFRINSRQLHAFFTYNAYYCLIHRKYHYA